MLRSMTGFGAAAGEAAGREVRVEVRAVNHRHLHVKSRLPAELAGLESEIEARVKKRLSRGAVTVHVHAQRSASAPPARIDVAAAERYRAALQDLALRFGGDGAVPLETVLALPGVVAADAEGRLEEEGREVLALVDAALRDLDSMRLAEGRAIEADLRKNADAIAKLVEKVEKRMPKVVREHHAALRRRVADLLGDAAVDPRDLARELALLADKLDVGEEVARLKSHMDQLDAILGGKGDAGRRLDFLVQEIFREANTIGAKCADAPVAHLVVDLKTRIERLREQVQNVE